MKNSSKPGKPIDDVLNTTMYYAVCKKCGKHAFRYATDPKGKKFHEREVYIPGGRILPPDKAASITRCPKCGLKVDPNIDFETAVENITVASFYKFYQDMSAFVKGAMALEQGHLQILEYCHFLGMDVEDWKRDHDRYDHIACKAKNLANIFSQRCLQFGCGKPKKPVEDEPEKSKIILVGSKVKPVKA